MPAAAPATFIPINLSTYGAEVAEARPQPLRETAQPSQSPSPSPSSFSQTELPPALTAANASTKSVADFITAYKDYCQSIDQGPRTWDKKMRVLGRCAAQYVSLPMNTADLQPFFAGLRAEDGGPLSGSTRHTHWRDLKAFYNYLKDMYKVSCEISWKRLSPKIDTGLPRVLSAVEYRALIAYAADRRPFQDYAMPRLLLESGLRREELTSINIESMRDNDVRVKGKTGFRIVPVNAEVMLLLRKLSQRRCPHDYRRNNPAL